MSTSKSTAKKKRDLAIEPPPLLLKLLADYTIPQDQKTGPSPSIQPKGDPRFEYLRLRRTQFEAELAKYAADLRVAMGELGKRPEYCESDEHRRQMLRHVVPISNSVRVLARLCKVAMVPLKTVMREYTTSAKEFALVMYPRGRRSPEHRIYRDFDNFRQWLARQTSNGRKKYNERQRKYRTTDPAVAKRSTEAYRAAERLRKNAENYRKAYLKAHGFELEGPTPPPRAYVVASDCQFNTSRREFIRRRKAPENLAVVDQRRRDCAEPVAPRDLDPGNDHAAQ